MNQKATIVYGASPKPDRYSYKALQMLREFEVPVTGVHPTASEILSVPIFSSLQKAKEALPQVLHTITLYVGAKLSNQVEQEILSASPARVIFNPGAENPDLKQTLEAAGIECLEACTLVLLRTRQF